MLSHEHVWSTKVCQVVMSGIPISEIYRGVKCHGIIYRLLVKYRSNHLAILTISTLPTKHNLLSFVYINRLNFSKTCIGTCLATSDDLYHYITGSALIKEQRKKRKQLEVQLFHLSRNKAVYRYHGIFDSIVRHFLHSSLKLATHKPC